MRVSVLKKITKQIHNPTCAEISLNHKTPTDENNLLQNRSRVDKREKMFLKTTTKKLQKL